jgi:tyrosyl-tRNA synthetase
MQLAKKIKELQNLYSWNQFYQETKDRARGSVCQTQIRVKKNEINELKTKKKGTKK